MAEHEKTRHAASVALIRLRTALKKTQAGFAVEVMKSAVTTIARWESSHPPRGDVLLRLASVAEREQLLELRDVFRRLYIAEAEEISGKAFDLAIYSFLPAVQASSKGQSLGRLTLMLEGDDELSAGRSFLAAVKGLRSGDPECKKMAEAAIRALRKAADKLCANPGVGDIKCLTLVEGDPLQPINLLRLSPEEEKP